MSTYSAYSKYSKDDVAVNYVGIGYVNPWFVDSYFDYVVTHFLEGMAELPEMAPADADHIIGSDFGNQESDVPARSDRSLRRLKPSRESDSPRHFQARDDHGRREGDSFRAMDLRRI